MCNLENIKNGGNSAAILDFWVTMVTKSWSNISNESPVFKLVEMMSVIYVSVWTDKKLNFTVK